MKKTIIILFSLPLAFTGFSQDFTDVEITSEQVRDNVHVLFGRGGNIGVLAGEDGFVLIDDQFAPLSYKIRTALSGIGPGEVTFTINTHFHYDHTGGNKVFGPAGAWIVAHENTRKKLMQDVTVGWNKENANVQEKLPDNALPKITFENSMKLHLNGQTAEEYGSYLGQLFTVGWNAEAGFEGYVNGMLGNFEEFRLADQPPVEIIEQSEEAIQFRWPITAWEQFFGGNELFGVSLQELVDCFGAVGQELSAHMGCTQQQKLQDGWLVFTVKKKQ